MNQWTHRHLWYFIPKSLYTTKLVLKPTTINLKTFWLFVLLDTCNHFTFTFHLHLMHLVWWYLRTRRSFFTYCCILLSQAFMLGNIRSRPGFSLAKLQIYMWTLSMVNIWILKIVKFELFFFRNRHNNSIEEICINWFNAKWKGVHKEIPGNHSQDGPPEVISNHVQQNTG